MGEWAQEKLDKAGANLEIGCLYGRNAKMASFSVNMVRWPIGER